MFIYKLGGAVMPGHIGNTGNQAAPNGWYCRGNVQMTKHPSTIVEWRLSLQFISQETSTLLDPKDTKNSIYSIAGESATAANLRKNKRKNSGGVSC